MLGINELLERLQLLKSQGALNILSEFKAVLSENKLLTPRR